MATASANLKLPEFTAFNAGLWFRLVETQFKLKKITTSTGKFLNTIPYLPAETLGKLPEDIFEHENYENLKESVKALFEKSKPELFEKLISSSSMTLTGRPSVFLSELQNLAGKVGVGDDLVKHKFLQALPVTISPVLISMNGVSLTDLGKLADEILPYSQEKHSRVNNLDYMAVNSHNNLDCMAVNSRNNFEYPAKNNFQNNKRSAPYTTNRQSYKPSYDNTNSQIPIGLRPFSEGQRPKVCRSHLYFGDRARTCKPWCIFPANPGLKMMPSSRPASPIPMISEN